MTKDGLVFEWRNWEGTFRDKVVAFVFVAIIFTAFWGSFQLSGPPPRDDRSESATLLRFREDELGRFWRLEAEENGPFPGRLEFGEQAGKLSVEGIDGTVGWNNYRSQLRPMGKEEGYSREDLAPKGVRVFPSRVKPRAEPGQAPPGPERTRQKPVLIPYDPQALAWLPDVLPDFVMPEDAGPGSASWRFVIDLARDGNVRESISLGGGDDAGQTAMEEWLRGVRFKPGAGDRWLGLRVEFVNQPDNGTEPE